MRIRCALVVLLTLAVASTLRADRAGAVGCDIPMIAQQVAVPPNVMIIVDNSGSMNEVMWHEDYDASQVYADNFDPTNMYYVSSEGWYSFNGNSAYLVDGLHGQNGRYMGNYLNWLFYHATDEQRAEAPRVTRQMVANTAVKQVINAASGLRYGIARFNYTDGGRIDAECGADVATLELEVDTMAADSWTPSAETLVTVMEYFQDPSGPVRYECQKNFVIFVTDGIPTKDTDVPAFIGDQDGDGNEPGTCASVGAPHMGNADCTDYLDDVAHYMAHNDMRPDLEGEQIVNTYTIGFGVDAPLLADTAENGDGLYRLAWNLDTLIQELGTVVGDIVNRISSGAAVAVVSTETGTDDRLYRGKFLPGQWHGYLEAFDLPYDDGDEPVWEAGRQLRDRTSHSRILFTQFDDTLVEFSTGIGADLGYFIAPDGPGSGWDRDDGYGVDEDADFDDDDRDYGPNYDQAYVDDVIEYVRGEEVSGLRDRNRWKLGDLVYSTPVVVGPPVGYDPDLDYHSFATDYENRTPVVYVGANDGMLHAFHAETGEEMWAFLPQATLHKLEQLADPDYCHQSYVDLSPRAYDVNVGGRWRTVLLGGQRTGGDSYFALDVTQPWAPDVLWETRIPSMRSSFTEPVLVHTNAGPVLWAGSGPDSGGGARFSVIDLATGDVVWDEELSSTGSINAATAPAAFDADFDGHADVVYQGDLAGNLWRFDISQAGSWSRSKIYDGDEPIMARPIVVIDEEQVVNVMFGTGRFVDVVDFSTTDSQRFVTVKDDGSGSTLTPSSLEDRTNDVDEAEITHGWYLWLENGSGERVTEPAVALEGVVYFTSFAPSTEPCDAGGNSWLYRVDMRGGEPIDEDEDGDLDDESRSESLGTGVASRPVVNLAGEELIVQTSDARLTIEELSAAPQKVLVRAWRERYDAALQPQPETGGDD